MGGEGGCDFFNSTPHCITIHVDILQFFLTEAMLHVTSTVQFQVNFIKQACMNKI